MSNDGNTKLTVLQDVSNDTKLVKVPTTSLGPERLLERNLNVANRVLVPSSTHGDVRKAQDEDVLDHLLAEVVIDTERFIFGPVLFKCPK